MKADWIEVEIAELCELNPRLKNKESISAELEVQFLPMALVEEVANKIHLTETRKFSEVQQKSYTYFAEGDVLFAKVTPCMENGKIAIAKGLKNQIGFGSSEFHVLRPSKAIHESFLFYFLVRSKFRNEAQHEMTGAVGLRRVPKQFLENYHIPLPPLPEQRAIVVRIEELFSELDHAVSSLQYAQAKLDIYRQAVLKKAFEGGFKSSHLDSWRIWKTKEVCENIKVGIVIQPSKFYSDDENGIKAFRSANVREFRINDSNWVYFSEAGNQANYRTQLKEGDVLIVRSGYPGTSCVVPKKYEGCNAIDILIATPNKDLILPEYLCAFNNSPMAKGLFENGARGVAQKHLNVGVYSNLELPIPSIEEQQFILEEIESRLSVADKLAETIQTNLQKSEALRQSILKKAFEGRLLSEAEVEACRKEAGWEPAERLLEKIKGEKSKIKK